MVELSVHLITYNNEKHIKETLDSILNQKVDFNYEIVVGDDCSSDNTLNIIYAYKEQYPDLFNVLKNNTQLGILKNFKATLDRCSGKYIFDIAGDDLLKGTNALQTMVDTLKTDDGLGFVDSGFDLLFEGKNKTEPFNNKHLINVPKNDYKDNLLLGKITPIGICFNKSHLYKYVDFETYINMGITIEDYPILVDLAMSTNFEIIEKSLHVYRVHESSISHQKNFEKQTFLLNQMKMLFEYFEKKYNYHEALSSIFYNNHYKQLLYYAAYFEKKETGKLAFNNVETKNLKDYIYYLASQNNFFKKQALLLKRKFLK